MELIEKQMVNKAMKDFRHTKAFAKQNNVDLNAIFYTGERLTPLQLKMIKDVIYSLSELNDMLGKNLTDILLEVHLDSCDNAVS